MKTKMNRGRLTRLAIVIHTPVKLSNTRRT